jgi:translation initiation factor IF-2
MSKIRIYELARELGVDNKVILSKAGDLGLKGKTSHSHSLSDEEADTIRRLVIRQAIGSNQESETVTTRVNKSTGTQDTIVERRKGNVIRRRKKTAADEPDEANEQEQRPPDDLFVADEEERLAEEIIAETAVVDEGGDQSLLEEGADAVMVVSAPQVSEEPTAILETALEVAEAAKEKSVSPEKAGPRILGKIELPARKPVPTPKVITKAVSPGVDSEEEGEGKGKKKFDKKRGKKREIRRVDLVDYDGSDARRLARPVRGGSRKDYRSDDAKAAQPATMAPKASKKIVKMDETITVGELSRQLSLKVGEVIAKLMQLGVMATINQAIDLDTATILASEFDYQVESVGFDETEAIDSQEDDVATLKQRPPVVTVMGHVDHGKTSLLDSIRNASVATREHGGITQHIGAYNVVLDDGRSLAFIDTPGHAAFTSMRARGAQVTDIVVLVVAADDGVMPQTVEAINHAKAANVTIIVAVNKMDKPDANPDRVKQQLAERGLQPEDWGGDTLFFPVSALKGNGIKELLEGILLVAELKELKANPDRRATGTIIEARQDIGRGTVATVLIQRGSLSVGDIFVTGAEFGRVRSMINDLGNRIEKAGPSTPVEITGLNGAPLAGDDFFVVDSEATARQVSSNRSLKRAQKEQLALAGGPISLEEFSRRAASSEGAELNIILKADVHGSVEAAREAIEKLSTEKVRVKVLHAAVGGVTESDIQLAIASKAVIIGFNVRGEQRALAEAENRGIELLFYRVIYELIDNVKKAMEGLLAPLKEEVPLGTVEVRETYRIPKIGTVAGCYVTEGLIKRGAFTRILRDSKVVHEGRMSSLRRFKDDVREVQSGYECGISVEGFNDVKSGDVLQVYEIKEVAQTLD